MAVSGFTFMFGATFVFMGLGFFYSGVNAGLNDEVVNADYDRSSVKKNCFRLCKSK